MNSEEGVEGGGGRNETNEESEGSSSGGRRERRGSGRERRDRAPRGGSEKRDASGEEAQGKREDGRERRRRSSNRRRGAGKSEDNAQSTEGSATREKEKGQRGGRGRGGQGRNAQKRAPRAGLETRTDRGGNKRPDGGYRKRDVSGRNGDQPKEQEEDLGTIDAAELFKKGKERLKEDRLIDACKLFKRAFKAEPENPAYMSYCGLASATGFGEIKHGLELCTRAIKYECNIPEFYINLAKVYIASGNKKGAIMALTKGTRYELGSDTLHRMLVDMGVRKQSILPFMKRSSLINKGLGILLRRTLPGFKTRKNAGK